MADEGGFLNAILANPADDLTRLVYADWLDEQETDEATRKAEFLRLTAANLTIGNHKQRVTNEKRIAELARHLPTEWLPVVSHLPIENCAAAGNTIRRPLQTIEFDFACPMKWEHLNPTADDAVRHCDACQQNVYYSATIGDARRNAARGRCVAVDVAIPRQDGDLFPTYTRTLGRVRPDSQAYRQWRDQQRRANAPDEVSAEREARRGTPPADEGN